MEFRITFGATAEGEVRFWPLTAMVELEHPTSSSFS